MLDYSLKNLVLGVLVSSIIFLCSCVSTGSSLNTEYDEVWNVEFTGQAKVTFKVFLKRLENQNDTYSIKGKMEGKVHSKWGSGRVILKIDGIAKNAVFEARLSGIAYVEGSYPCYGKMIGTITESEGFGSWHVSSGEAQNINGEWSAQKKT